MFIITGGPGPGWSARSVMIVRFSQSKLGLPCIYYLLEWLRDINMLGVVEGRFVVFCFALVFISWLAWFAFGRSSVVRRDMDMFVLCLHSDCHRRASHRHWSDASVSKGVQNGKKYKMRWKVRDARNVEMSGQKRI